MSEIEYNLEKGIEKLREIKAKSSSFHFEEKKRQEERKNIKRESEKNKKYVLNRIKQKARDLEEVKHVNFKDEKQIKKDLKQILNSSKIEKAPSVYPNKGGRPKLPKSHKFKKYSVSVNPEISDIIERRKNYHKTSRSTVLNEIASLGLKYEKMRESQAEDLKKLLKSFMKIFSKLKFNKKHDYSWRYSKVYLERNEEALALLYLQSEKIQNFLMAAKLEPEDLKDLELYFSKEESLLLSYASDPGKIAEIVRTQERSIQ